MFNAEKLLGGMLRNAMGNAPGKGVSSLMSGGAALGAVGIAMEAVEHFMKKPSATTGGASGPPPAPGSIPSPPPSSSTAPPPPPPPPSRETPAPPAASPAVLLVRAMIAAAAADGNIDEEERRRILDNLAKDGLSGAERSFLLDEMESPLAAADIAKQVATPKMAQQVYLFSLAAIRVDTEAERGYLRNLAQRLGLDAETVAALHQRMEADGMQQL
jgi:uncharacterized membrane protein YebE (DUF533 family)